MNIISKIQKMHGSRTFEIRVYESDGNYIVAGYENGNQKTAGYSVTWETNSDFRSYHNQWAHEHFVKAVSDDIEAGRVDP